MIKIFPRRTSCLKSKY